MLRDKRERQRLEERGTERRESQKERDRETQNAGCHNGERDPRILLPIWEAAWVRERGCLELYTQGPMSLLSPPPGLSFMPLQIWSKALAVSGILTMGLALLGCVGALKELRCLLGLYFGILLLLFVTQITLVILICTQWIRLERRMKDMVLETIRNYHANPEQTAAEESWDYVQFQLRCCGWNSPQDWDRVPSLRSNESEMYHRVPCSCYNSSATNDSSIFDKISLPQFNRLGSVARPRHNTDICSVPANSDTYREGCERNLKNWLYNNLISIVGICLGVGLLELSFMTLSIFLCRNLDQVYDRLARYR
ncbi:leukocyte antigen CD37 isoform X3 [Rousettus aegyptiacus]|nr:leukocyte antigen CD37 isoform X3 [Rousettus aegyptiacus]